MPGAGVTEDLGYTEEHLESTHICLIYESDEQRRQLVGQFLAAGLRQGEIVRYLADTTPAESIRGWLRDVGVDAAAAEAAGTFAITDAAAAYCPDGVFDPQGMIDRVGELYGLAHRNGYTGEMTWVHRGLPGSDLFLAYEGMLNSVSTPYRHFGMCQYDARRFDGAALFQVLQVHPFMVAQGQIVRNPYYRRSEDGQGPGDGASHLGSAL
jgi:hypothetical protein